jgi:hypothetical protein
MHQDFIAQEDDMDFDEFRFWDKHCNEIASALGEWRERTFAMNTLESRAKAEGFDEFVNWYWGTARDSAYKRKDKE